MINGGLYSLVEEDDVGLPDLVWREPQHADPAVVRLIPLELVVVPHLNTVHYSTVQYSTL